MLKKFKLKKSCNKVKKILIEYYIKDIFYTKNYLNKTYSTILL